jgi:ABC-type nitrate/sulfonate/bicarbonate transport system substrate-binding protein
MGRTPGLRRREALGAVLAAAASARGSSAFAQQRTRMTIALNWIPNVQFAGLWIGMERGHFAAEGIEARFTPGGPNAPDPLVQLAANNAQLCTANWLPFLDAVGRGNDFVILGAIYGRSPGALCSMARRPIREPRDLVNARVLAQTPSDRLIIEAILGMANQPREFRMIPTGFSPEPLVAGDGDAYFCFAINQPITLERMGLRQGTDFHVTLLHDLGYRVPGVFIITRRRTIEQNRREVVGFLRAFARGWRENEADAAFAARLAVQRYGAELGLDLAQQTRQNELQIPLVRNLSGPGLLWFDPATIEGSMSDIARASSRTVPPAAQILDLSLLEEALRA